MDSARRWAGVVALAIGIFVLITVEELPIGVLSVMAPDLGVSEGVAGLAVTVPGILAGAVALCTPVLVRGLDRRLVLVLALASVALSCALSVIAPTFAVLLLARLFAGVAIGLYWAVMAIVALGQVPAKHAARALTIAFAGAGGALVLGVPVAAWIGTHLGWRLAFAVVGIVAAGVALLILVLVEPVRSPVKVTGRMMLAAARTRGVRYALGLIALAVVGQFLTYSYISPVLLERAGVGLGDIGLMLLVFGVAGLVGNFAVGPLVRRSPPVAVLVVVTGIGLSLLAVLTVMDDPRRALAVMAGWGLCVGAISVAMQAFIGSEAGEVLEEATALNSAGFNTAIAIGALIGGLILDAAGLTPMILTSVLMVGGGALLVGHYLRTSRVPDPAASLNR
ncbi:arabinose ABC transporter permease [Brachybacterium vulturis]|uniref:Arabinose ABC transporter permease n=1 Tax=Brachybacterium vulturis TaxID=2017484 RepID=A0A291GMJ6_9MICO|nr:MFS transporter [Brachybacterium vulturis]ATG51445.1 arabinose ABC transporter permease [Brachybacterium vulturis]